MENTIIYDLKSLPEEEGFTLKSVIDYYKTENVLIYNSQNKAGVRADVPQIINNTLGTKIFDVGSSQHEGILKFLKESDNEVGK